MLYLFPVVLVSNRLKASVKKSKPSIFDMLIRGTLSGAFLGYATSLVFTALSQGLPGLVGAIIFPVGFVILVLLGLELATGNFALLAAGWMDRRVSGSALMRNWIWVLIGNLLGSVFYAVLFYLAITNFGMNNSGALADLVRQTALKKTTGYAAL